MSVLKSPITPEDHIQGSEKALITLVEYGDYQCPYCGAAYPIVKNIQKHFGDQLRFVFRNFPLTQSHPFAQVAAETAEFASDHDRFWEMHDLIYENQQNLSVPFLLELANRMELPVKKLEISLENQTYAPKVQKDFISGVRSGVNGTPTFFINNQRYNEIPTYENLIKAIDAIFE